MKKTFIAILAVAVLAACNKAEVVDVNPGEAIAFGDAFVDNSTRAAADPSYTANDIESFKVYGTVNGGQGAVVIYPGTIITKGEAAYGVAWTCPVQQYWVPGAAYKFVGIVDGDKENVTKTTLVGGMPTAISYTADGVTDLLCQTIEKTANTDGTANGLVSFDYTHLLAKAKFTVTNASTEATNYLHKVRDIKISNAYNTATYDVADKVWKDAATNVGQAFDGITAEEASTECANEKLLIPGLTSVTVEFVVDLYYVEGETETLVSTTPYSKTVSVAIEAAKAYDFNITVKVGELIQFTVTEQPEWNYDVNNDDVVDETDNITL